jgi:hypothetical protein
VDGVLRATAPGGGRPSEGKKKARVLHAHRPRTVTGVTVR